MKSTILKLARKIQKKQITWRRHLHQYPELSFQEHKTTTFLKKLVDQYGLKQLKLDTPTGLIAELKGKSKGPTIALRSDIDALPVTEQTGLPFSSRNKDRMHACGHDMHMATLLGVMVVLSELQEHLHGNVRFLFQPAEEMPPGGAIDLIRNNALKNVSMIIGLHVDPRLPTGQISLRNGPTMASVTDFDLIVRGKSGHAARPHDTVDAIVTACEIVESLQKIVSRETDPLSATLITIGKIEGGRARNIISDEVRLSGTARAMTAADTAKLSRSIKRVASAVAKARGAKVEIKLVGSYPVLCNDKKTNQLLRRNYGDLFGTGKVKETDLVLGGEDFARYLEIVPGAMFRLGIKNRSLKADKPWHSPFFIADEAALYHGTALITAAVTDFLAAR